MDAAAQEAIALPDRETLTIFSGPTLPDLGPVAATDQTTAPVASAVGDATGTATGFATDALRSAPTDQNTATAQNVNSPGSTATASQIQYAPVTAPVIKR